MVALLITLREFMHIVRQAWRDPGFRSLATFSALLLALGSAVYHVLEGWSWLDSLYFCMVTLATVGYGDLTPSTPLSKLFTMVYLLLGIGVLVAVFTRLSGIVIDERTKHLAPRPSRIRPRRRLRPVGGDSGPAKPDA